MGSVQPSEKGDAAHVREADVSPQLRMQKSSDSDLGSEGGLSDASMLRDDQEEIGSVLNAKEAKDFSFCLHGKFL